MTEVGTAQQTEREAISHDGLRLSAVEWSHGGATPTILMVHATGFCKELADPIVSELEQRIDDFEVLAIDQRSHGDSDSPEAPVDAWDIGRDVLTMLGGRRSVVGVGHSSGATAVILAELLEPGTFSEMVLVEPIVFPPPFGRFYDNPLSQLARKRRASFASPAEAHDNWKGKPPFREWDARALRAYVSGGLKEVDGRWELKCSRDDEAEFYMAITDHAAWERLDEIATPACLVAGEWSDSHSEDFLARQSERMPGAKYVIVPGTTHFLWMERPDVIANEIVDSIRRDMSRLPGPADGSGTR